ncbi:L-2-hydroxyglutarate oxidase LhgO [Friedmanniella endophytica]|uniref:L-2-hydroxyglutarate oxidase LhgO n=1 Tax=Microlunatus kandeliicorticis TaxID=1759536 RepID=A0A7W3IQ85_9ACTN|nr:L-2-hydroxyglutarate oxidase [Microlunatus kandeliicorticis]MBA8793249.1 L-2-hydroxyglutarate oxidase LhgO [Microlunatus kandeliicorticis]
MSDFYDVIVVGAGIVGLATARQLLTDHPSLRVAVLEKETGPGRHQSGHNSGVLHAGVYYKPGSLKAQLCVDGKARMERFADEHGVSYELCGKLIIATEESELGRLADLEERGHANGVPGLRVVGPEELREIEPHAAGIRALHSPRTGIIDFAGVTRTLARLLVEAGAELYYGHEVRSITRVGDESVVTTGRGEFRAKNLISCAGLHSDRVARMDADPEVAIYPFRGDYYTLTPEARHLCRGLIYPVPDPALPFLGVHFTKRFDQEVWAGPNAVLAGEREGYKRSGFDLRDLTETLRHPGFPGLARKHWKTGAAEIFRDVVKAKFVKDLQRYVPEITGKQLVFGPSGVRAQAVDARGGLVDDFVLSSTDHSVHVLNAPSPAATASLAIADRLAGQAAQTFGLSSVR